MTPERWQKVKDICYAALDCEPDQRTSLLHELCAGDGELRREVEVMLADALGGETGRVDTTRAYAGAGALALAVAGTFADNTDDAEGPDDIRCPFGMG